MKKVTLLFSLLFSLSIFINVLKGQAPQTYPFFAPAPTSPTPSTIVVGRQDGLTYYYFIVTHYAGGNSISPNPGAVAFMAPNNLTNANYVTVFWTPQAGAIGYDVIRLTTQNYPGGGGGSCTNCLVANNTTAITVNDNVQAIPGYTLSNLIPDITGSITLLNNPARFVTTPPITPALTAPQIVALFAPCTGVQYLGADGGCHNTGAATVSIGGAVAGGTTGSVLFVGAATVLAQDNANFFYDVINHRLGIGTTTPTVPLDVNGSGIFRSGLLDVSGSNLKLPSSAGFTASATNMFGYDTTNTNAHIWDGADTILSPILGTPTDTHCTQFGVVAGRVRLVDSGAICGTGSGMAIGGAVTSATPGSILFAAAGPVLAQDNANFFYDSINKCLTIGTNSCNTNVAVFQGQAGGTTQLTLLSSGVQQAAFSFFTNALGRFQLGAQGNGDIFFSDATHSRDFIDVAGSGNGQLVLQPTAGDISVGNNVSTTFKLDIQSSDSGGTARFYDQTPATGVTHVIIQAGAGQSSNLLLSIKNNAGVNLSQIGSLGGFSTNVTGVLKMYFQQNLIGMSNDSCSFWSSNADLTIGTPDTGFCRNAAGVMEINNGTPGTLRDLTLRNLTSSGIADLSAANLKVPSSVGFTGTTNNTLGYDTTNKNFHVFSNAVDSILALFPASVIPTAGDCPKWVVTANVITLSPSDACSGGSSVGTNILQKSNGSGGFLSSAVTDNGTTVASTEPITAPSVSTGSTPPSLTAGTGGATAFNEGTIPSICKTATADCVYADSTQHGLLASFNNGTYLPLIQGPASSTSGNVAGFNSANGGLLQDGGFLMSNIVRKDAANTFATGLQNLSAVTIEIPTGAGFTASAVSMLGYDTTNTNIHIWNGADVMIAPIAATPVSGRCPQFAVAAGKITLVDSGSTNCGGGGATALSAITAAVAGNTIANGDNAQIWNFAETTAGRIGFIFGETSAASSTGTPYILQVKTLIGSTATPLNVINSLNGSQTLPALSITPTWNTTGVVDAALFINVTNTASGAASKLADYQIGGTSQWNVDKAGNSIQLGIATALGVSTGSTPPTVTSGTGGAMGYGEGTAPSVCAASAIDCIYASSVQHGFLANFNNAGYLPIVQGPATEVTGDVATWNGTNGGLLADSGILATNLVTAAANMANGAIPTANGTKGLVVSNLQITTNTISNLTATTNTIFEGGLDATNAGNLGGALFRGSNNAGTGGAGNVEIQAGKATAATPGLNGLLILSKMYPMGAGTSTQWGLQCINASGQINDCSASPTSFAGTTSDTTATGGGGSRAIYSLGSQAPILASAAVTLGDTVCAGTTAHEITDSGGTAPCGNGAGITVGTVIAVSGTYNLPDGTAVTVTTTLPIVDMSRTGGIGLGGLTGLGANVGSLLASFTPANFNTAIGVTGAKVIANGTATLGTGAITANTCASVVTVTATGAATTDAAEWIPNADISGTTGYGVATTDGLKVYPYITTNNINFKVCNGTGLSITPGAVTLNWVIVRNM